MAVSEWTFLAVVVLVLLYMWMGLLFFIPWCFVSLFRYRLWRLRDSIFDAVIDHEVCDDPVYWELIRRIENYIRHAKEVTFLGAVARGALLLPDMQAEEEKYLAKVKNLSPEDRHQLDLWEMAFSRAVFVHLLRGAPSGWIGSLILMPTYVLQGLKRSRSRPVREAKRRADPIRARFARSEIFERTWETADKGETMSAFV